MSPTGIRNLRIQELTKMALKGAKREELFNRAQQLVSTATAYDYLDEVAARLNKLNK